MIKILLFKIISVAIFFTLCSCAGNNNGEKKDTTELWKKAQTKDAIIERSGTVFGQTSKEGSLDKALADAENRLQSGGGLFGKKGISLGDLNNRNGNGSGYSTVGLPINPYLWKASLETIQFMPILSADPFGGIITTDWYSVANTNDERCKINVFIKGQEMKTSNLKVNSFCQKNIDNKWVSQERSLDNDLQIENAILNKAKKIRLSNS